VNWVFSSTVLKTFFAISIPEIIPFSFAIKFAFALTLSSIIESDVSDFLK
jgi:hypothetical protein